MIREIKYVCTATVDYFTCHSIFSKITDGQLSRLKLNTYSKQPSYKVSFQDRVITILVDENDFDITKELPLYFILNHQGKELNAVLMSDKEYQVKSDFKVGDFVYASGVISYAKNIGNQTEIINGESVTRKHKSPITPTGNFQDNQKKFTFKYLESRLGLDLSTQIDKRDLRFEIISYKHFESNHPVFSKSNRNKISIHNVFSFELEAYVKDVYVANSLEYQSVGKKRSYGFGNVYLR